MIKFLLLISISSCSFFISKIDTPLVDNRNYYKNIPDVPTYCPLDHKLNFQLVGPSENSQAVYNSLIHSLKLNFDFLDHFALWSLLQLSSRPDQSSPTSRFQALIHKEGQTQYFDFFSEETTDQYPYFYGVDWILKKFGKKQRLEYYAAILDQHLGKKILINKELENFLSHNQDAIKNDPELSLYYVRGTEILKENESFPKINYSLLLKNYRKVEKNQKIIINTSLSPFITEKGSTGNCNYDFNLYDNSIFLIDKIIPVANMFGLAMPNAAFMVSSSQKLSEIKSLNGFPLFKGESKIRSSAVCVIENNQKRIWTFSNQSRDPGQHLFHLVRYGLPKGQTISEIDRLIRHSRHLFLSDPVRLVIESRRSKQDQIENLLKLNLPIYNAEKLGNIWAYVQMSGQNRFIIDDRNPGSFTCK
ncbi:MAG: hypothetical protein AB7I27_01095 [Bacteriovoracaceae bacterium]